MVVSDSKEENDYSELSSFVSGTLKAIVDGIGDAQKAAKLDSPWGTGVHAYNAPKKVTFDIAVTAERNGLKKGGFELKILSVGANAGGERSSKDATVSRITFTVPTAFKRHAESEPESDPSDNWKTA
jgi:hypothetical protein